MFKYKNLIILSVVLLIIVVAGFFIYSSYHKVPVDVLSNINVPVENNVEGKNMTATGSVQVLEKEIVPPLKEADTSTISGNAGIIKKDQEEKNSLKFIFFGDTMLDRHVGERIKKYGADYPFMKLFRCDKATGGCVSIEPSLKGYFSGGGLVALNLEGAVTDKGAHYAPKNAYDFAITPALTANMKKFGFNFFNLANNHILDQGRQGYDETLKNLKDAGYDFSGCPDSQVGECSSSIIEKDGYGIGMAGLSMVYKKFDQQAAKKIITALASSTDLVIVNIHWGTEYTHQSGKAQQETARLLIDSGADIIIGHHPHVVQGMEIYKDKPIFYSLGNFIFDQYFSSDTQEGLAVGIAVEDGKASLELFPLGSKLSQPAVMAGKAREEFLKKFAGWSKLSADQKSRLVKDGKIVLSR